MFVERGVGDVLLTWETRRLIRNELGADRFEIVDPCVGVLAETPVAVVDRNVDRKGTRKAAEAYLQYLYSPEGEAKEIATRNFYRPSDPKVAAKYAKQFPKPDAGDDRRRVRRLAQCDEDALRRRRELRPDLPAGGSLAGGWREWARAAQRVPRTPRRRWPTATS